MPYIERDRRETLKDMLDRPRNLGELNFVIHGVIFNYLEIFDEVNYAGYNAVIGVLECVKLELYRRMVAVYEDEKIAAEGDVYPPEIPLPVGVRGHGSAAVKREGAGG